jgi:protein-ribulosamine 3-kinase
MNLSRIEAAVLDGMLYKLDFPITSVKCTPVGGGSINHTYRMTLNDDRHYFLKVNEIDKFPGMFDEERIGLECLGSANVIRIPGVIDNSLINDNQILVMEWINQGARTDQFWKRFGEQLAALHHVQDNLFGFTRNNFMGALPQSNRQHTDWSMFFTFERLEPQLRLALDKNLLSVKEVRQFEKLNIRLPQIFSPSRPVLLHGDLWSGNFLCDEQGRPVLIDPAVYFGHPSIDLAMTTLFGGFDKSFYDSYNYVSPFPTNYREQWEVCNLYPLLVHLNLFGESYRPAISDTIRRY